jgi:anti-sigma factor ChrR (cupin superfamily)
VSEGVYKTSWTQEGLRHNSADAKSSVIRIGDVDSTDTPVVTHAQLRPHYEVPPHSHDGWTFLVVLNGGFTANGGDYGVGDIRIMAPNTEYSFVAGDEGVTFIEFFESSQAMTAPAWTNPDDPRISELRTATQGRTV